MSFPPGVVNFGNGLLRFAKSFRAWLSEYLSGWRKPLRILAVCLILALIWVPRCVISLKVSPNPGFPIAAWHCIMSHLVDLITIWLALSGIVYAVVHDRELRKQTNELGRLEGSLSTRRIAPFPMYLLRIRKLAKAAKKEAQKTTMLSENGAMHLDILADCLDYGSFFAPEDHAKMHKAICRAANTRGVRVRILVCVKVMPEPLTGPSGQKLSEIRDRDPAELLLSYCNALLADAGFMSWIKRLNPTERVWREIANAWFVGLVQDTDPMPAWEVLLRESYPEMIAQDEKLLKQLVQIRQLWFAKDLQRAGVEILCLPDRYSMFFWIKYKYGGSEEQEQRRRDARDDAMFTFSHAAGGEGQLGFTTHDYDLLNSFRTTFENKWADAQNKKKEDGERLWLMLMEKIDTFGEAS